MGSVTKAHWRSPATSPFSKKWSGIFPDRSRVTPPGSLPSRILKGTATWESGVSLICGLNLDRYFMGSLRKQSGKQWEGKKEMALILARVLTQLVNN